MVERIEAFVDFIGAIIGKKPRHEYQIETHPTVGSYQVLLEIDPKRLREVIPYLKYHRNIFAYGVLDDGRGFLVAYDKSYGKSEDVFIESMIQTLSEKRIILAYKSKS